MLRRIKNESSAVYTVDEVAQEIRQFEKHLTDRMEQGERRDGFEYACELIGDMLNKKVQELDPNYI